MVPHRASLTARFVAACRGLSPLLPVSAQLVEDPLGAFFASDALGSAVAASTYLPQEIRPLLWAPMFPLLPWTLYMQLRTRAFDEAIERFVHNGGTQVVLLGAGFDARATRLKALANVRVFEVDHPATQTVKRKKLGFSPENVCYIPWDFEHRPLSLLPSALQEAGLNVEEKTFTLWEGVTMYLSKAALDGTVQAVQAYSAPGSQLAFNYLDEKHWKNPGILAGTLRSVVRVIGEPFQSAFAPEAVVSWMNSHGFSVIEDRSYAQLANTMLPQPWRALARVARRVAIVERSLVADR